MFAPRILEEQEISMSMVDGNGSNVLNGGIASPSPLRRNHTISGSPSKHRYGKWNDSSRGNIFRSRNGATSSRSVERGGGITGRTKGELDNEIEATRREILQSMERSPLKLYPEKDVDERNEILKAQSRSARKSELDVRIDNKENGYITSREEDVEDDMTNFSKYDIRNISYRQNDEERVPSRAPLRKPREESLEQQLGKSLSQPEYKTISNTEIMDSHSRPSSHPNKYHENVLVKESAHQQPLEPSGQYEDHIDINPFVDNQLTNNTQSNINYNNEHDNTHDTYTRPTQKGYNQNSVTSSGINPGTNPSNITISGIPTPKISRQISLSRSKSQTRIRERPSPGKLIGDSEVDPPVHKKRSISEEKKKRQSIVPQGERTNRRQSVVPRPASGNVNNIATTITGTINRQIGRTPGRLVPPSSIKPKPSTELRTNATSSIASINVKPQSRRPDRKDEISLVEVENNSAKPVSENENLFSQQSQIEMERKLAQHRTEIISLKAKLSGKDLEIKTLKASLEQSELTVESEARQREELISRVAKELHVQYNKKHEAKIGQFKDSVKIKEDKLSSEIQMLKAEVENLRTKILVERDEKAELVSAFEAYQVELERMGIRLG